MGLEQTRSSVESHQTRAGRAAILCCGVSTLYRVLAFAGDQQSETQPEDHGEGAQGRLIFCIKVYRIQLEGRRHLVHEHPEKSRAWEMPELTELMMHPEIGSVVLHMCALRMVAEDEKGEAPVRKGTRRMSSSGEVLK